MAPNSNTLIKLAEELIQKITHATSVLIHRGNTLDENMETMASAVARMRNAAQAKRDAENELSRKRTAAEADLDSWASDDDIPVEFLVGAGYSEQQRRVRRDEGRSLTEYLETNSVEADAAFVGESSDHESSDEDSDVEA